MKRVMIFFIIFLILFSNVFAYYDVESIDENNYETVFNANDKSPSISARAAVLFDRKSKRVLFDKNANKEVPNASTTKIMTAIVAYENGEMEDAVLVSKNAVNVSGSKVKFKVNDQISLNDLIHGLLLCSGNDAAIAIAEHIGGSIDEFCFIMNEKAKEIGALNTNFTSPHGLDYETHYSTAYDLAIMADYALNIPYIANVVKKKTATIKISGYDRQIANTNEMLSSYQGADGVKTGYTGDAGRCLVTSATQNGWQLISVVLGCDTKKQRTDESTKLLNYGFKNFKLVNLCENMKKNVLINVYKSRENTCVSLENVEFVYPVSEDELSNVEFLYSFTNYLEAPVESNTKIGEIEIKIGGKTVKKIEVVCKSVIQRKTIEDYFCELLKKGAMKIEFVGSK